MMRTPSRARLEVDSFHPPRTELVAECATKWDHERVNVVRPDVVTTLLTPVLSFERLITVIGQAHAELVAQASRWMGASDIFRSATRLTSYGFSPASTRTFATRASERKRPSARARSIIGATDGSRPASLALSRT